MSGGGGGGGGGDSVTFSASKFLGQFSRHGVGVYIVHHHNLSDKLKKKKKKNKKKNPDPKGGGGGLNPLPPTPPPALRTRLGAEEFKEIVPTRFHLTQMKEKDNVDNYLL